MFVCDMKKKRPGHEGRQAAHHIWSTGFFHDVSGLRCLDFVAAIQYGGPPEYARQIQSVMMRTL